MPDAAPSTAEVQALLASSSPYSPSSKAKLEAYLQGQAQGSVPYSPEANRALLKLYQFFPTSVTTDDQETERQSSALILLLALLQYPSMTDLLSVRCLVPERLQVQEPCASLVQAADFLDACQFADFWNTWTTHVVPAVPLASQGVAKMQAGILQVLALSYRTAPLPLVLTSLHVTNAAELVQRASSDLPQIETVDAGDNVVVLTATADNTKRNRVYQDVDFQSITNLITKIVRE